MRQSQYPAKPAGGDGLVQGKAEFELYPDGRNRPRHDLYMALREWCRDAGRPGPEDRRPRLLRRLLAPAPVNLRTGRKQFACHIARAVWVAKQEEFDEYSGQHHHDDFQSRQSSGYASLHFDAGCPVGIPGTRAHSPRCACGARTPAAEPTSAAPAPAAPSAPVDIDAVLTQLAATHHERLDWKHSIVDLLKVLSLDSSLAARRELATELHYSGDEHDTAAMNIWLHREVIAEVVKNGGKVPDELKH